MGLGYNKRMSKYFYTAKNLAGEEKTGSLEAQDERQLASILKQKGYFLLSSEEKAVKTAQATIDNYKGQEKINLQGLNVLSRLFRVPLTEKLFFTRNLEVMVKTGVSIVRSFEILANQTKTKKFKTALLDIATRVTKGESLSDALGQHKNIFSDIYRETVKVGEETGKLDNALHSLARQMEEEHALKSKIKSAMVYPVVVLCMALLIGVFMLLFAVPKMQQAFTELNVTLPITTRVVLGFAGFITGHAILSVIIIAVLVAVIALFLRSHKGGRFKSWLFLSIPVVAKIVKQTNSALTLRTLSSLLSAGVPVVRALEVTSGALGNFYFKESLKKASVVVRKGERVSVALKPYEKIYSPMVLQMMEIGEETGETAQVLEKLADFLEEEVSESTQRLSSVVEPFLIFFIGGIVGFFAIAMMQPMFSIMGGI